LSSPSLPCRRQFGRKRQKDIVHYLLPANHPLSSPKASPCVLWAKQIELSAQATINKGNNLAGEGRIYRRGLAAAAFSTSYPVNTTAGLRPGLRSQRDRSGVEAMGPVGVERPHCSGLQSGPVIG
jgi:hypothetical protein